VRELYFPQRIFGSGSSLDEVRVLGGVESEGSERT
jgi:hypothetical protein